MIVAYRVTIRRPIRRTEQEERLKPFTIKKKTVVHKYKQVVPGVGGFHPVGWSGCQHSKQISPEILKEMTLQ